MTSRFQRLIADDYDCEPSLSVRLWEEAGGTCLGVGVEMPFQRAGHDARWRSWWRAYLLRVAQQHGAVAGQYRLSWNLAYQNLRLEDLATEDLEDGEFVFVWREAQREYEVFATRSLPTKAGRAKSRDCLWRGSSTDEPGGGG